MPDFVQLIRDWAQFRLSDSKIYNKDCQIMGSVKTKGLFFTIQHYCANMSVLNGNPAFEYPIYKKNSSMFATVWLMFMLHNRQLKQTPMFTPRLSPKWKQQNSMHTSLYKELFYWLKRLTCCRFFPVSIWLSWNIFIQYLETF